MESNDHIWLDNRILEGSQVFSGSLRNFLFVMIRACKMTVMSDAEAVGNCISSYREDISELLENSVITSHFTYTENVAYAHF